MFLLFLSSPFISLFSHSHLPPLFTSLYLKPQILPFIYETLFLSHLSRSSLYGD
ncbi:uncharacterized protein LACBIDRAFT_309682 [Laccaria bicolor S238N-H82]|uniref:Predicted protein n=1 Tax=Laccaria bicolor (strain S238N-H82 / ATCC MYA-4686) TaxID=486041 RepID=B0DMG5_LACBS|nr:uncharacterized protein LACBIDRAFT_304848 [Laccaria bicolor S238N-H82]XP_001886975.1 uncharacterized protein LACBIDRAFT_309682 [Laccaria bicolor S238N-H82]EDR02298.1 predicted protein [Laccaria bicolor S238N-H82]EDR04184.1 predicted protein [Laccaria bicolor S238N-H82]|eukprot:XP_001885075.1 predicted protein [Laccaria bicolor S238N-H82]